MKLVKASFILAIAMVATPGAKAEISFPIHAFGVSNSKITIDVEQDTIVPSLEDEPLTQEVLEAIVPYPDAAETASLIGSLLARKEQLTLGSTALYFYLAVNLALDRIYRNYVLGQGDDGRSSNEKGQVESLRQQLGGMSQNDRDRVFSNLRKLTSVAPLSGKNLRLRIFGSRSSFNRAAQNLGLHSASAYWDPTSETLGIYFDATVFRWLREKAGRQGQEIALTARQVRDYVTRQAIELLAHELIHFIHHSTGHLVDRPFLAEGAALLIQSNIALREELSRVTGEQQRRGLPFVPDNRPCLVLMKHSPPMFGASLTRFQRGIDAAKAGVPVESLLLAPDSKFYAQSSRELARTYNTSLAFAVFASAMSEKEFTAAIFPLIKRSGTPPQALLKSVASEFKKWATEAAEQWQPGEEIDQEFSSTMQLASACMNNRDYPAALIGSWRMLFLRPNDPMAYIYAGDVFFRLDVPFFAFDLYARANELSGTQATRPATRILLLTRLGDAFEVMGDIDEAVSRFKKLRETSIETNPELAMPLLRSRLKATFYEKALQAGYARHWRALYLLNSYVDDLQAGGCTPESRREFSVALSSGISNGVSEYLNVLSSQFNKVHSIMNSDLEASDVDDLWRRRTSACPALKTIVP